MKIHRLIKAKEKLPGTRPSDDDKPLLPHIALLALDDVERDWVSKALADMPPSAERDRHRLVETPSSLRSRMAAAAMDAGEEAAPKVEAAPNEPEDPMAKMVANGNGQKTSAELLADLGFRTVFDPKEGFGHADTIHLRRAFDRFKPYGAHEINTRDLCEAVKYLGHSLATTENIGPFALAVSAFGSIDFEEFVQFMEKFIMFERSVFKDKFDSCDDDGSGSIDKAEMRMLMISLGFMPLQGMMQEAWALVDVDGSGSLDFHELIAFFTVYTRAEGFTKAEVSVFSVFFDRAAKSGILDMKDVPDAIVLCMGLLHRSFSETLVQRMIDRNKAVKRPAKGVTFNEFFIIARECRVNLRTELETSYKTAILAERFGQKAPDSIRTSARKGKQMSLELMSELTYISLYENANRMNRSVFEKYLQNGLSGRSYTPLRVQIDEIITSVLDRPLADDDGEEIGFDFGEFFDVMQTYFDREGFLKQDLERQEEIFSRFDFNNTGDISVLELNEMTRHMGYRLSLDQIRDHLVAMDNNHNARLDFREFRRLMRTFLEMDLRSARGQFETCANDEGIMKRERLLEALEVLGHQLPDEDAEDAEDAEDGSSPANSESGNTRGSLVQEEMLADFTKAGGGPLDFDDFVAVVATCRANYVERHRKKCGFTDLELAHLQEMFNYFDANGSGDIDISEFQAILKIFKWEPRTRVEQQVLMKKIDQARRLSSEAGVDVAEEGSIVFWVFVRMCRMLKSEHETLQELEVDKAKKECDFLDLEVDQFRMIFKMCIKEAHETDPEMMAQEMANQHPIVSLIGVKELIHAKSVRRLIRQLGCSISGEDTNSLYNKLAQLDENGRREQARIPLNEFLLLMKWLMRTNFAGINAAVLAMLAPSSSTS